MQQPRIELTAVSPQYEGQVWSSDTILRIGRLNTLEVFFDHPSISRRHAEILATDDGWVIHDLGSMNGTYLNSTRLGRTDRRLRREDVVQCGKLYLVVTDLVEPPQSPPRPTVVRGTVLVRSAARRPWDRAVQTLVRPTAGATTQARRLLRRLQTGYHLCHAASLAELLVSILEDAVTALDARRGTIILATGRDRGLDHARAVSVPEPAGREHRFSRTLVQRAFGRSESLLGSGVADGAEQVDDGPSTLCALLRSPRHTLGVLYLDRPPEQDPFTEHDLALADSVAASVSVGIESVMEVERQRDLLLQTVAALAQAVEVRDCYTGGHTQRVTAYALLLAENLRLAGADKQALQLGVPLHDVGKIGIPDDVLRKSADLTPAETALMRSHVEKGLAILETVPGLAAAIPITRSHHERWDGSGYPDGLKGEAIPLLARVVAVADAFDAMTSDRPYRKGMPMAAAMDALRKAAGTQFDPACVAAFTRVAPLVEKLLTQEADLQRLAKEMPGTSPNRPALQPLGDEFGVGPETPR